MDAAKEIGAPIDTSHVRLGDDITELAEKLAENAHKVWAATRIADGWTKGPKRDDDKKHHPGLVPYEELSEGEKEYDRKLAVETIKLVMALGFEIKKKP